MANTLTFIEYFIYCLSVMMLFKQETVGFRSKEKRRINIVQL